MFVVIILGATDHRAPKGLAPIGLALTLIHLIAIPVTNTSANPARSTSPALIAGGWAIQPLWMFWLAPTRSSYTCRYGNAALASSAYATIPTRSRAKQSSTALFNPGWRR